MSKFKLAVSACLLGENCKYDGTNNYNKSVCELEKYFDIVPICPEVFGGMSTPRYPSEIRGDRVINSIGEDITSKFNLGADNALYVLREKDCVAALLKKNSPSCGKGKIYDGTFSKTLVYGNGITANKFISARIEIYTEDEIEKLLDLYISPMED